MLNTNRSGFPQKQSCSPDEIIESGIWFHENLKDYSSTEAVIDSKYVNLSLIGMLY